MITLLGIENETARNLLHLALIFLCVAGGAAFLPRLQKSRVVTAGTPASLVENKRFRLCSLVGILLLSAALRFYGLAWGLPQQFHPDEFEEAKYLRNMMRNESIDPEYTQQPPLILYISWPVSNVLQRTGTFAHNAIVRNVFAGRIVNTVAGIISVFLVYAIARRLFLDESAGTFCGLVAALITSVAPLHVTNSRYMKQDALLVMFVLGCALAVLKGRDTGKARYLYLAGALGGLAMGTKYSGAACAAILLMSPWLKGILTGADNFSLRPSWTVIKHALGSLVVMIASFFLSMPYVFLETGALERVFDGMKFESKHAAIGHHGLAIDPWSQYWMYHFSRSLIPGIDLLVVLAACIGIGFCLREHRSKGLFLVALVLLFYLPAELANSKPPPQPDRYVLACVPFIALLAAACLQRLRPVLPEPALACCVSALLILPLSRTLLLASELKDDTRTQMREWLDGNLPPGSRILLIGGAAYLPRIPGKFHDASAREVIGKDKSHIVSDLRNSNYDFLMTTNFDAKRFAIANMGSSNESLLVLRGAMRQIEENFTVAKQLTPRWGSYGFHNPTLTLYALH